MSDYNPIVYVLLLFFLIIFTLIGVDYLVFNNIGDEVVSGNKYFNIFLMNLKLYPNYVKYEFLFKAFSSLCLAGVIWIIPSKRKSSKRKDRRILNTILLIIFSTIFYIGFFEIFFYDFMIYPIIVIIHYILLFIVIGAYRNILKDENILGVSSHGENEYSFTFNVIPDKEKTAKK